MVNQLGKQLDRIRSVMASQSRRFFPDVCQISSPGIPANDGAGGYDETPTTQSNIPCRLRALSGAERITAGAITEKATLIIDVPATIQVNAEATIIVAAHGAQPERTFQVVAPLIGSMDLFLSLLVTEG